MNPKTKQFREKVTQAFLDSLKTPDMTWKKSWQSFGTPPQNAATGAGYKGINRLYLMCVCDQEGITDRRFATFKQIKDNDWHLKKGSHGLSVEYWMPVNEEHKAITWGEYRLLTPAEQEKCGLRAKYYTVFRAKDIEGIPPLPEPKRNEGIRQDEIVSKISKNMKVDIMHDGGDRAFYRLSEDRIHMPEKEFFDSEIAYNSVALHELTHATGAPNRLDRVMIGSFGSQPYAYEELVAEISSAFMSENLQSVTDGSMMQNHQAYVQNWSGVLEKNPDILMKAVKDAERAANYLEYMAELIPEQELRRRNGQVMDVRTAEERERMELKREIKKAGLKPTEQLMENMSELNRREGRKVGLKEIAELKRSGNAMEQKELIDAIAEECKGQQMAQIGKAAEIVQV